MEAERPSPANKHIKGDHFISRSLILLCFLHSVHTLAENCFATPLALSWKPNSQFVDSRRKGCGGPWDLQALVSSLRERG